MRRIISSTMTFLLTTVVAVVPAYAQRGGGGGHGGGGGGHMGGGGHIGGGGGISGGGHIGPGGHVGRPGPAMPRGGHGGVPRGGVLVPGRAVPGHVYGTPYYRPYYNWGYRGYNWGYRGHYPFVPHLNLGFGVWLGYPYYYGYPYYSYPYYGYPYRYYYRYPNYYAYPYPYVYGAAPHTSRQSLSDSSSSGDLTVTSTNGALSFEITPSNAEVWVDGTSVGVVADFAPTRRPLELAAGRHAVEIRASGYRTLTFDADIDAGQVLPYRGSMQHE